MEFELHFKSIAVRWFTEVFAISAAVTVIAVTAFSAFFSSVYNERVVTLASDYSYEFEALSSTNPTSFTDSAITISDSFAYKNKIEVQIIDSYGQMIISTSGFQSETNVSADYNAALKSPKKTYISKGRTDTGEKIVAGTTVLINPEGQTLGAYRWVSSLTAVNRKITEVTLFLSMIGLLAIAISAFSGIFFIKSIVKPIRDVSNMARKIAGGDFKSRIELEKNDEIGELCDTINYMATELDQAETIKNDFISSVSHELRTPLTAIRGWGETAKMSVGTDEELVKRGLDVVLSEADRLSNLVEELLDFSRMQSGRLSVNNMVPVNVTELLKTAADMYGELAKKQGIEVSFMQPAESATVEADADRLKQVFINIIDNAVKYTEKGGLVLITQILEEGCVRITVKDTGVGIPAADIDHVKEKFFKSNKNVRGSGIGLAVADEIIKQHQGLLFLESTEGVGTAVTVVLPLCEEEKTLDDTVEETAEQTAEPAYDSEAITEKESDTLKGEENG